MYLSHPTVSTFPSFPLLSFPPLEDAPPLNIIPLPHSPLLHAVVCFHILIRVPRPQPSPLGSGYAYEIDLGVRQGNKTSQGYTSVLIQISVMKGLVLATRCP